MSDKRSVSILTGLNLVGGALSVVYSVLQARLFGVSREMEVFFAATTLIYLFMSLTQVGQLGEIFLPHYHRLKFKKGTHEAHEGYSIILNWMILFTLCLSVLFWLISSWIVGLIIPGFSIEDQELGVKIFRSFIPLFVLLVTRNLIKTLFNAEKWYGIPEFLNVTHTLITIIVLVLTYEKWGIWSLILGMWVGNIFQIISYSVLLYRFKFHYRFAFKTQVLDQWKIFRQMLSTMTYVGATQVYSTVLTASLSFLPQGYYGVYKYVQQLYTKTNGILLRPVSTVFFTRFSESIHKGLKNVKKTIETAINYNLMVGVCCVLVVVSAGEFILRFLWYGNKFGEEYITIAYQLLILFFSMLIISGLGQIYRKTVVTLGYVSHQYLWASSVHLLSAIIAWSTITFLGPVGIFITISTNFLFLALVPALVILLKRKDLFVFYRMTLLIKWSVAFLVALLSFYAILNFVDFDFGSGRLNDLITSLVRLSIGVLLLFTFAWIFRISEISHALNYVLSKVRSLSSKF